MQKSIPLFLVVVLVQWRIQDFPKGGGGDFCRGDYSLSDHQICELGACFLYFGVSYKMVGD